MDIQDPRTIPQSEMPLLVDVNQISLPGDAIDLRTSIDGQEPMSHSQLSINSGQFVRQSPSGYKQIPMSIYMIPGTQLVFWELVNANNAFDIAFRQSVINKLQGSPLRKAYNWLQIIGQAIGLPWLSFPGLDDCVQDVIFHVKAASRMLPDSDYEIIQGVPNNCDPEQWYVIKKNNPSVFKLKYTYDSLTGLVL